MECNRTAVWNSIIKEENRYLIARSDDFDPTLTFLQPSPEGTLTRPQKRFTISCAVQPDTDFMHAGFFPDSPDTDLILTQPVRNLVLKYVNRRSFENNPEVTCPY